MPIISCVVHNIADLYFEFKILLQITMKSSLYCKSSTVLRYFPIDLLVITIPVLFSGATLLVLDSQFYIHENK